MHCTLFKCLNPFFPDSVVWIWADKPPTGLLSLSEWLIRLTRKREKLFSWSAMWVAWHTHETQTQATFCKITFLFLFTSKYFGMYNSFVWGSWATYSTPETTEDQSWEKKKKPNHSLHLLLQPSIPPTEVQHWPKRWLATDALLCIAVRNVGNHGEMKVL